jgi:hypothetical protein
LQTISYEEIDYKEPPGGDSIALQDEEDRYFDDEEPTEGSTEPSSGRKDEFMTQLHEASVSGAPHNGGGKLSSQNGQGEYDY